MQNTGKCRCRCKEFFEHFSSYCLQTIRASEHSAIVYFVGELRVWKQALRLCQFAGGHFLDLAEWIEIKSIWKITVSDSWVGLKSILSVISRILVLKSMFSMPFFIEFKVFNAIFVGKTLFSKIFKTWYLLIFLIFTYFVEYHPLNSLKQELEIHPALFLRKWMPKFQSIENIEFNTLSTQKS